MIEVFSNLSREETDILYGVPVWVFILIAGADNDVDNNEIGEAIRLLREDPETENPFLEKFYKEVGNRFEINLKGYMILLPSDTKLRTKILIEKISQINKILPKIDRTFAIDFYHSLKQFSNRIAAASGGIFGFFAVSEEEAAFLDLPMIKAPA